VLPEPLLDDRLGPARDRVAGTTESTTSQCGRPGIVFRRLRDAPPVPVRLIRWRADPNPATRDVVGLLAELYRRPSTSR